MIERQLSLRKRLIHRAIGGLAVLLAVVLVWQVARVPDERSAPDRVADFGTPATPTNSPIPVRPTSLPPPVSDQNSAKTPIGVASTGCDLRLTVVETGTRRRLPGLSVWLFGLHGPLKAVTDDNGLAEYAECPSGTYRITGKFVNSAVVELGGLTIDNESTKEVLLEFPQAPTYTLRLVSIERKPFGGLPVQVVAYSNDARAELWSGKSNSDGTVEVPIFGSPSQVIRLCTSPKMLLGLRPDWEFQESLPLDSLSLPAIGEVREVFCVAELVDAEGVLDHRPALSREERFSISCNSIQGTPRLRSSIDSHDGVFHFLAVPDSIVKVRIKRVSEIGVGPDLLTANVKMPTKPGRFVFHLGGNRKPVQIAGRVLSPEGEPLKGFLIGGRSILGDSSVASESSLSDASGRFELQLQEGDEFEFACKPASLEARLSGFFLPNQVMLTRAALGDPATLEIVLSPRTIAHGSIRTTEGLPVSGAAIMVVRADGSLISPIDFSDESGDFILELNAAFDDANTPRDELFLVGCSDGGTFGIARFPAITSEPVEITVQACRSLTVLGASLESLAVLVVVRLPGVGSELILPPTHSFGMRVVRNPRGGVTLIGVPSIAAELEFLAPSAGEVVRRRISILGVDSLPFPFGPSG